MWIEYLNKILKEYYFNDFKLKKYWYSLYLIFIIYLIIFLKIKKIEKIKYFVYGRKKDGGVGG